jgi:hypothetical protein
MPVAHITGCNTTTFITVNGTLRSVLNSTVGRTASDRQLKVSVRVLMHRDRAGARSHPRRRVRPSGSTMLHIGD